MKTDLFDRQHAAVLRDIGIDRVRTSTEEWQARALLVIKDLASLLDDFTTDDVWRFLGRGSEEGRAMGAAMRTAAFRGWVERTDETRKSERVSCHRRDLRVWRSLLRRHS